MGAGGAHLFLRGHRRWGRGAHLSFLRGTGGGGALIFEGAQEVGAGGGCHTSGLMFYLIFPFFRLLEIFPIIKP